MLFLVLILLNINVINGQDTVKTLNQILFSTYDPMSRPVKYASNLTDVCVGLYVLQISGVKEKHQVMQANVQFVFIWNDAFLHWEPRDYENVSAIQVRMSKIWTPDIIILNSVDEKVSRNSYDNYLLRVRNDGSVRWQFQTLSRSFCQIDIMNFPFDEQKCDIRIRSSARDQHALHLKKRNKQVKVKENIRTEWFIIDSIIEETTLVVSDDVTQYTVIKFELTLRRVITYYIFKIIIPFSMIAFITLFTFLLAPDSGEKLTLDVTILLSLVIYLQYMSDYIPRSTTNLPILTIFTLTNFFLVFLSCIMSVFVLRIYHRSSYTTGNYLVEIPYTLRLFLFKYVGRVLCYKFHLRLDNCDEPYATLNLVKRNPTVILKEPHRLKRIYKEYVCVRNSKDINEQARYILFIMKLLNYSMNRKLSSQQKQDNDDPLEKHENEIVHNLNLHLKIVQQEWKQAAIIFDKFLFFVFMISMPLTITIFLRVNVIEYILSSNSVNNYTISNANLC